MTSDSTGTGVSDDDGFAVARRAVLKATGASAALGLGTGTAAANAHSGEGDHGGGGPGTGDGASNPNYIDPIFGQAVAEGNPCGGEEDEDCFEEFRPPIRPSHEIKMEIGIEGLLFGLAEAGVLSPDQIGTLNEVVADGEITQEERENDLTFSVTLDGNRIPSEAIANAMIETVGFHYHKAGLHVEPGDIVLYSAESPDHAVAAYHERHGRQNRVPEDVGPISSAMPPIGGYWLYQFETEGVYDFYCPPHQAFGMVHRVVVHDGEGDVPQPDIQQTGRPPQNENALPGILGGLDPNIPSSAEVFENELLDPANIVEEGAVLWEDVVADYRSD